LEPTGWFGDRSSLFIGAVRFVIGGDVNAGGFSGVLLICGEKIACFEAGLMFIRGIFVGRWNLEVAGWLVLA
jgi:hypothetical protein